MEKEVTTNNKGIEEAKRAILHTLLQIRNNSSVGWYLGSGTETFDLLTQAAATLFGEPVEKVREFYSPLHAANPRDTE